jgi:RES domain-containing protein
VGDAWLVAALTLTLHVPAAPVPEELNVLINPVHPEAARVRVVARRPFFFDPRLVS